MIFEKKHWFCLSFIGNSKTGGVGYASTYVGYPDKLINKPRIEHQMTQTGLTGEQVLLSVSYLGRMKKEEMIGEDQQ